MYPVKGKGAIGQVRWLGYSSWQRDTTEVLYTIHTHTHTHTHFRVQSLKKGVSENEAPGPVGAYTTTHNNTPTQMPDRESILLTATFDQVCSFCREETGL